MKKSALALALVLLPASVRPTPATPVEICIRQEQALAEKPEARLEQQKSKWVPNGMKMLIIHGKRRWAEAEGRTPVKKRALFPIQ